LSNSTFGPTAIATPANLVTAARVAMTPVIAILVLEHGTSALGAGLWVIVSFTDKADGWLARRQGATRSGAFLDPLADKILVFGVLAAMVVKAQVWWLPVAIMGAREVWMSWHRTRLARRGISVPARPLGKLKTFFQMAAVLAMIVPGIDAVREPLSVSLIWIATGLALVSGYFYFIDGRRTSLA
jgi:CDP-diacylglycerol--glycerol-3-phosphate 3-phosphatidyltransferase